MGPRFVVGRAGGGGLVVVASETDDAGPVDFRRAYRFLEPCFDAAGNLVFDGPRGPCDLCESGLDAVVGIDDALDVGHARNLKARGVDKLTRSVERLLDFAD